MRVEFLSGFFDIDGSLDAPKSGRVLRLLAVDVCFFVLAF